MTNTPDTAPELQNRLRQLRIRAGLTQDQMARALGLSTASGWARYEPGGNFRKSIIGLDLAKKIAEAIVGKGKPPITSDEVMALTGLQWGSNFQPKPPPAPRAESGAKSLTIKELDVVAAAGDGAHFDGDTHRQIAQWQIPSELIRSRSYAASDQLDIIRIKGNSCEPELHPGDRVIVDRSDCIPSPPGLFAIYDGFATVAKVVQMIQGTDPPRLRLSSINEDYDPYECSLADANIVGRIIGYIRML